MALSHSHQIIGYPLPLNFDLDLVRKAGHYDVVTPASAPAAGNFYLVVLEGQNAYPGNIHVKQIAWPYNTNNVYVRYWNGSTWSAWASAGGGGGGSTNTLLSGSGAPTGSTGADGDFYIDKVAVAIYGPKAAGAWGSPTSLIGAPGSPGAPGAPGSNGTNGNTMINGTTAPGAGIGANGDFYLDTAAKLIYGPKTAGAWGSGVSYVGPPGSNGTNGSTILNGAGAPSNLVGANGDFYFDTTNVAVYGPKAAGAWPGAAFANLIRLDAANQAWTGGVIVTPYDYGTPTSGANLTLNPGLRPLATITNNAPFNALPSSNNGTQDIIVTNGATAGAITFSGWTRQLPGDSLTTTVGHKFLLSFMVVGTTSLYQVTALQ